MSSWIKLTSVLATAALLVSATPVVSEKRQLGEYAYKIAKGREKG